MGIIFKAPAFVLYVITGFWSLFLLFGIVRDELGIVAAFLGVAIFPVLLYVAPFYAGFVNGDWFPLLLSFGGGIASMVLFGIGSAIDGDR